MTDAELRIVEFLRTSDMTDAELRIVEFLRTSDATRPADLPDWLLALLPSRHMSDRLPCILEIAVGPMFR